MKWYVINLRKHKSFISVLSIFLFLMVTLSVSIGSLGADRRDELFVSAATDINNSRIVIIDAGHGGEDSGAVADGGVYEKDIALSLAFEIGRQFEARGYAVVYTRTEDKLLYTDAENIKGIRKISDLKNRCKIAADYPNAIFVSVHMNSFAKPKYSGLQVYYSENNELSREIASSVQKKVREELQPDNNRAVKKSDGIYVLENVENPAILVECGFLSNPEECKKLLEKEYQRNLSFSIVCGIIDVIER